MIVRSVALWALALGACNPFSCGPPANPERFEEGRTRWIYRTAGSPTAAVLLADGGMLVGTARGELHRITDRGDEKWVIDGGGRIGGLAVAADGRTVFAGVARAETGAIVAFDAGTGRKRWERPTPGRIALPAVLPDGSIVIAGGAWLDATLATEAGAVSVLDASGRTLWRVVVGKALALAAPAVAPDGTIVVAIADGTIVAIDRAGHERWRTAHADLAEAVSIVARPGGGFAVLSPAGLAVLAGDGDVLARRRDGYRGRLGVAPDGTIFAVCADGSVAAFGADGRERWRRRLERSHGEGEDREVLVTPIDVVGARDGGAYVVTAKEGLDRLVSLVRLSARGRIRWKEKLVGLALSLARPVPASGRVVVPAGHWNTGSARRRGKEVGHQRVTCLRD